MSDDLFSSGEPVAQSSPQKFDLDESCALCIESSGEFNWGKLCCRARFVTGLPDIDLRRGWMARWKSREIPDFYSAIEQLVKIRWKNKAGIVNG